MTFNRQLAFNDALTGLLAQGRFSTDSGTECRYRDNRGNKCAIGMLIPDENYDPGLEGVLDDGVCNALDDKYGEPDDSDQYFLEVMQESIHDDFVTSGQFFDRGNLLTKADVFAVSYDLEMLNVD